MTIAKRFILIDTETEQTHFLGDVGELTDLIASEYSETASDMDQESDPHYWETKLVTNIFGEPFLKDMTLVDVRLVDNSPWVTRVWSKGYAVQKYDGYFYGNFWCKIPGSGDKKDYRWFQMRPHKS